MKRKVFYLLSLFILGSLNLVAQQEREVVLKTIKVNKNVSTHFISYEDIKYVDISVDDIVGDIPKPNILRVKPKKEGASGVLTINTEKGFIQYFLLYSMNESEVVTRYNIDFDEANSYINSETKLTRSELFNYANKMFVSNNHFYDVSTQKNKLKITLNNIYTLDDYFFIDISMFNKTKIKYDIDDIRFKIKDKKKTKATNIQSLEIKPILHLTKRKSFKKKYRNIFVFNKFTFPQEKIFTIEVSEKQISGRVVTLEINYSDVLNADSFTH